MGRMSSHRHRVFRVLIFVALASGAARDAWSEGFVSPFVGYNFGGEAGCPNLSSCRNKHVNGGIAVGIQGPVFGLEIDFNFTDDFFGSTPGLESSSLSLMSGLMLAPKIGPFRPYLVAGVGLLRIHVAVASLASDTNNLAGEAGGGLSVMFNRVGVRGDVRYFNSLQDVTFLGLPLRDVRIGYGRASAGIVVVF
jgi:hypothetical protein